MRTPTTRIALATTVLALAAGLTACGGGDTKAYCDDFKALGTSAPDMTSPDAVKDWTAKLEDVAKEAPSDVKDDWDTVVDSLKAIEGGDTAAMTKYTEAWTEIGKHATDKCS